MIILKCIAFVIIVWLIVKIVQENKEKHDAEIEQAHQTGLIRGKELTLEQQKLVSKPTKLGFIGNEIAKILEKRKK